MASEKRIRELKAKKLQLEIDKLEERGPAFDWDGLTLLQRGPPRDPDFVVQQEEAYQRRRR